MTEQTLADVDDRPSEATDRGLGLLLTIGGAIGLLASATLIIDKVTFLQNEVDGKSTELGCDLNAFVSCGGVINTDQASVFGFLNPLIGVVGFAMVLVLGVLVLAGVRL